MIMFDYSSKEIGIGNPGAESQIFRQRLFVVVCWEFVVWRSFLQRQRMVFPAQHIFHIIFVSFLVPSFNSEWLWWQWKGPSPRKQVVDFMKDNYPPDWTYADFAKDFNPPVGIYDPEYWAEVFNASGARYILHYLIELF